jgi:hypothetical protein
VDARIIVARFEAKSLRVAVMKINSLTADKSQNYIELFPKVFDYKEIHNEAWEGSAMQRLEQTRQ